MKKLVVLAIVVLLLSLTVASALATNSEAPTARAWVILRANSVCKLGIPSAGLRATGWWKVTRTDSKNGNFTKVCQAQVTSGDPPAKALHFFAIRQGACNVKNSGTVSPSGQVTWVCQGKLP